MVIKDHSAQPNGWLMGQQFLQSLAKWALLAAATLAVLSAVLAIAGVWPWLELTVRLSNGVEVPAGPALQIGLILVLLSLCAFLPGVNRILALEHSHRRFHVSMEDVAHAYRVSHAADRKGAFALSSEFDSVRARLQELRQHPDLSGLEPDILELAAQMSHTTRDLAQTYSDEKLSRAKAFLKERQAEIDSYLEQIALAFSITEELKRWQQDIEASGREADRQMDRLEKDLREVLPLLGYEMDEADAPLEDSKVVPMTGAQTGAKTGPKTGALATQNGQSHSRSQPQSQPDLNA